MGRLPGIRADSVIGDEDWQQWTFPQFTNGLRKQTTGNPKIIPRPEKGFEREMYIQQIIKITGTVTVLTVRNLGIKPVTAKQ